MKRLIFIASLAMLAVGCQKTEIQNEVLTPIGFSTEVGKQTRAIADGQTTGATAGGYLLDQPFAVYAYGHQDNEVTTVMDNVEISFTEGDVNATPSTSDKWAASVNNTVTTKYYWPNDPNTTLNFYAYSPAANPANAKNELLAHQKLTGTISHSEQEDVNDSDYGLKLTDYEHSNMYVDFMVATPVEGATYGNADGGAEGVNVQGNTLNSGEVPLSFAHKMTQLNFTVKIKDGESYPNVDFKINSIVLNNIVSNGSYTYMNDSWAAATTPATSSYKIYPATTVPTPTQLQQGDNGYSYGAPALTNVNTSNTEDSEVTVILRTDSNTRTTITEDSGVRDLTVAENPGMSFSTTPVTMIPQSLTNTDAQTDTDQSFTISYTISGAGVAKETVVKTFDFADAAAVAPEWGINKKITYTLTISLNEITFAPSVATWSTDDAEGSYVDPEV